MIFQGKELHIGDKLVSKRKGMIEVSTMYQDGLAAIVLGFTCRWDYEGRYFLFEKDGVCVMEASVDGQTLTGYILADFSNRKLIPIHYGFIPKNWKILAWLDNVPKYAP